MLNEIDEFRAYTTFPEYTAKNKYDSAYLGLFTFDTLVKCEGLNRVLTVLARGYLWRDGEANTDRAYDALRAGCSIPDRKNARPRREVRSRSWWTRTAQAGITGMCIRWSPSYGSTRTRC